MIRQRPSSARSRLYREVIAGERDGKSLWRELKASNQYGVTRGPLAVIA